MKKKSWQSWREWALTLEGYHRVVSDELRDEIRARKKREKHDREMVTYRDTVISVKDHSKIVNDLKDEIADLSIKLHIANSKVYR